MAEIFTASPGRFGAAPKHQACREFFHKVLCLGVLEEGNLREAMLRVRWRLLMGVIALVATVAVSLPAAASKFDLGQRVSEIWPNSLAQVDDVIWPNSPSTPSVIWPNAPVPGDGSGGSQDYQGTLDTTQS